MTGRRVLVCGGRDYSDEGQVAVILDAEHAHSPIGVIIHGHARGADTLADQWAARNNVSRHGFKAQWDKHGKAAGPIRNARMLEAGRPELVIAFPGGSGTQNMITQARAAGVPVIEVGKEE